MAHTVCGNATTVVNNTGKLVVVGPRPVPMYKWSTAIVSNMLKEDGQTPVTTIGDVIFELNTDPINVSAQLAAMYSEGQLDDFRNVAYKYECPFNGHACMRDAGQVSNGVHAKYGTTVPGFKTVFVAYRIIGIPVPNSPMFSLGSFCMRIVLDENHIPRIGSNDMSPAIEIPMGPMGPVCVLGIQFALSGSDTDFAYIGNDATSVTRMQNSWFTTSTPAGPDDIQNLILGFWPDHPGYVSSPVEWFEVRYYATNTITDLDMIRIRNEMKAQYA